MSTLYYVNHYGRTICLNSCQLSTSNIPIYIDNKFTYIITESSVDLSNFEVLFETIITALKPVVYYTEVDRALASSKYANKIDANALAQKIILEISPYVREALQKQVKKIQDQVVQLVITDVKPTVIPVVEGMYLPNHLL